MQMADHRFQLVDNPETSRVQSASRLPFMMWSLMNLSRTEAPTCSAVTVAARFAARQQDKKRKKKGIEKGKQARL